MALRSCGESYPQPHFAPSFESLPPPGSNVCAFPTREQLDPLLEHLKSRGLGLVSIGCGEGFLEGLLEQEGVQVRSLRRKACLFSVITASICVRARGTLPAQQLCSQTCRWLASAQTNRCLCSLQVTCVDVDYLADPAGYANVRRFCTEVRRVGIHQVYNVPDPERVALMFCFGRRTVNFERYLRSYQGCPAVVIIGDTSQGGVTDPSTDALAGRAGWRLVSETPVRAVCPATMAIYEGVVASA